MKKQQDGRRRKVAPAQELKSEARDLSPRQQRGIVRVELGGERLSRLHDVRQQTGQSIKGQLQVALDYYWQHHRKAS